MSTVPGVGEERVYFYDTSKSIPTETIKVSNPFDAKIYSANVLKGTQDFEGRVKTLNAYQNEIDSEKKSSNFDRNMLRIGAFLMVAALVAGIAVGITQGITPLAITSGVLFGLVGMGYFSHRGISSGIAMVGAAAFGPLFLLYDLMSMKCETTSTHKSPSAEVKNLIDYLSEQKPHIDKWLGKQKAQLETQIEDHRKSLKPDLDLEKLQETTNKISRAKTQIEHIDSVLKKLESSLEAANRIEREQNNKK